MKNKSKGRSFALKSSCALAAAMLAVNTANAAVLEEVIVSAQKREQALSEVPISIVMVGGEDMKELGLSSPFDLVLKVPGLDGEVGGGGTIPRWNLRGLSFEGFQPGNGAPVAVYYDEVFSPDVMGGFPLFDMQGVEVLKGPQGTLWGGSTTGGLIHFISKKPEHGETDGYVSATAGNEGQIKLEGASNFTLIDNVLTGRVSLYSSDWDSYFTNRFPGNDLRDNKDRAIRVQLAWDPTDDLSVNFNVYNRDFEGVPPTYSSIGQGANGENTQGYIEEPGIFNTNRNDIEEFGNDVFGTNLKVTWNLGAVELVSLTSYADVDDYAFFDGDSSPVRVDKDLLATKREQVSQEFRVSNAGSDGLQWTLGAYYYDSDVDSDISFVNDLPGYSAQTLFTQEDEYMAVFGQATQGLTDNIDLTVGLRHTSEEKSIDFLQVFYTANPENMHSFALASDPYVWLDDDDSQTWDEFTGEVILNYHIDESNSVYGKISRGFRGGNYDSAGFSGTLTSVEPELLTSFEIGGHFNFNNQMGLNTAVFYYDIENLQVVGRSAGAAFATRLFNADEATVWGLEGDLTYQATDNFSVNAGFSYVDTEYGDDILAENALRMEVNVGGNHLTRAPDWSGFLGLAYEMQTDVGTFKFRTDWRYVGETFWGFGESDDPDDWIRDPFVSGDARVAYVTEDEKLEVSIWVRNLTEEDSETGVSPRIFNGAALKAPAKPRLFGITAQYNF